MRLFTAIEFDKKTKATFSEYVKACRQAGINARYTLPNNFHMTLHFIGECQYKALSPLERAMESAALDNSRFEMDFSGSGSFSTNDGSRLLWIGLRDKSMPEKLYLSLGRELQREGFKIEGRPFKPHITIAREAHGSFTLPKFPETHLTADSITLFESKRINGILTYIPVFNKLLCKASL